MRKICPFIEPWPLAMIEPKRLRNSFTMTPESMPFGALDRRSPKSPATAARNSSRPSACAACARGPRQHLRVLDQLRHADRLDVLQRFAERQDQRRSRASSSIRRRRRSSFPSSG